MKVLQIHNRYQFKGGEDAVADTEKKILEQNGHSVVRYFRHNNEIHDFSVLKKAGLVFTTSWSLGACRDISRLIGRASPDIAHFHNTVPLVSPAAYRTCRGLNIPVVQTLHNFRLVCPNGLLFRGGRICEECLSGSWLCAIRHACYRDSRAQTAAVAFMTRLHRWISTWDQYVDAYIALTGFMKEKLTASGIPEDKIYVKPNSPGHELIYSPDHAGYALFMGRLSREKGVETLVRAWRHLPGARLYIAGDGPLKSFLQDQCGKQGRGVRFTGYVAGAELRRLISHAMFVIHPSEWYETFGLAIVEAFSAGKPVIAAELGASAELITHGTTGLLFRPKDPHDLAAKIQWALDHPGEMQAMGRRARAIFEEKYTETSNYDQLIQIYQKAMASTSGGRLPTNHIKK